MPELPDPKKVYRDAKPFLAEMIRGDLAVRRAGLALAGSRTVMPTLLVCRRIRGKLRFVLTVHGKKTFLFGLFRKKHENQLANLRVYLQIEPVVETEPAIGVPRSTYVGPDFLVASQDPRSFILRLTGGGVYETKFQDSRAILTHTESGITSNGRQGRPAPVLRDVLDTIRDWMLRKKTTEPVPLPKSVAAQASKMVGLMGQAATELSRFASTPPVESTEFARMLAEIDPDLAPRYRLDWLELRLLTRVNSAGTIVLKPKSSKTWLQVDVQAKLHRHSDSAELRHSLFLPDFLIAGNKYHPVFVESLRDETALAKMDRAMFGGGDENRFAAIKRFARDEVSVEDFVIARVQAGETTGDGETVDHDLVLLRDRGDDKRWVLLLVEFRCRPFPDIAATVESVACIGGEFGGIRLSEAEKPPRFVAKYLYRLLRVLTAWRVELGVAS